MKVIKQNKVVKGKRTKGIAANKKKSKLPQMDGLQHLASALLSRSNFATQLGQSYGGDRNIYTALGYPTAAQLTFDKFLDRYSRQDIAKRVVDAPVEAVWRRKPEISDSKDDDPTDFEKAWEELQEKRKIYHYLARVDKAAGIGQFGVLFMGFNDVGSKEDLKNEVSGTDNELMFLRPYTEGTTTINKWDTDVNSERYGQPEIYKLNVSNAEHTGEQNIEVHWTRVIHVSDGMLEDNVYGTPRLKDVYNRLQDLELVAGGSSEMFWRGAFPGLALSLKDDAQLGAQDADDLTDEMEEYMHQLKRYIRVANMDVQSLAQQISSPKEHADVLTALIAGAKGIPVRILLGSERGELASSQDERAWDNNVDSRRRDFVEPWILRPLINRLIEFGVLPTPKEENYDIVWPDLQERSEKDQADTALIRTEALTKYAAVPGSESVVPPGVFRMEMLGFSKEENEAIEKQIEKDLLEEEKAIEEEERIRKEIEAEHIAAGGQFDKNGDPIPITPAVEEE
jgi:hypothetical protein